MGIRSVAVYSDADADARHVAEADIAVRIGPAPAARELPRHRRGRRRGRPHRGRRPCIPVTDSSRRTPNSPRRWHEAGIVVHRAAGRGHRDDGRQDRRQGDGVGVRGASGARHRAARSDRRRADRRRRRDRLSRCWSSRRPAAAARACGWWSGADELPAALVSARREAAAAFGDDTLFLERFVLSPRHIEVQVLADGTATSCTSASASAVCNAATRRSSRRRRRRCWTRPPGPASGRPRATPPAAWTTSARGRSNSSSPPTRPDEFFFMEMNTRLQVEHPVTEMVTGIDLVECRCASRRGRSCRSPRTTS